MLIFIEVYFTMNLFLHMNEIGKGSSSPGSQSLEDVTTSGRIVPWIWKGGGGGGGGVPSLRWQTFPSYIVPTKCKINGFSN